MAVVITYHIQFEYRGGQLGYPVWVWSDHHRTYETRKRAKSMLADVIKHHESMAAERVLRGMEPFTSGRYRIIERHIETTETVVDTHKAPRGEIRA